GGGVRGLRHAATPPPHSQPLSPEYRGEGSIGKQELPAIAREFFARALAEDLSPADVFRITITSFLDAYNFDVRRLMKCCIHHVLPSGHLVPFCAYNVLYRPGHVPLPALRGAALVPLGTIEDRKSTRLNSS